MNRTEIERERNRKKTGKEREGIRKETGKRMGREKEGKGTETRTVNGKRTAAVKRSGGPTNPLIAIPVHANQVQRWEKQVENRCVLDLLTHLNCC